MKEKYLLIDKMLTSDNDFKMSLFDLEYNQIISKISRMAYKKFDAKTPAQANKIVDYICNNYVPKVLLNKWRTL
jgi:hypothetical protein